MSALHFSRDLAYACNGSSDEGEGDSESFYRKMIAAFFFLATASSYQLGAGVTPIQKVLPCFYFKRRAKVRGGYWIARVVFSALHVEVGTYHFPLWTVCSCPAINVQPDHARFCSRAKGWRRSSP